MTEEGSILLNPEEVKKRRVKTKEKDIEKQENIVDETYTNRQDRVEIRFESNGRFSLPNKMFFRGFNTSEVHDIVLTKETRLLETLIAILNECKDNDTNCNMGDSHPAEFLETLIMMKAQFQTVNHEHLWLCDKCQRDEEDEPQKTIIDLTELIKDFVNIEEIDEKLKVMKKEKLDDFSEEEFKNYLKIKYNADEINFETFTKEDEIENTKLQEPFQMQTNKGLLLFRFPRVGDLVKAQKFIEEKYAGKIKRAQKQSFPDIPKERLGSKRKEAVEALKNKQDRDTIMATRAFSILKCDNKTITDDEKFEIFSKIDANILLEFTDYLNKVSFGLNKEIELTCEQCGHVNKRLLQRELDFSEFLPVNVTSEGDKRKSTQSNIFF